MLTQELEKAKLQTDQGILDDLDTIRSLWRELGEIQLQRASRVIENSRARLAMSGEKPSKFYLNLQKKKIKK